MSAAASPDTRENAGEAASWALRMAQRAFAALIEGVAREAPGIGAFRAAQLLSTARRTLSVLSADDHARLARWLALQISTGAARDDAPASQWLARVDAMLGAAVGAAALRTREALHAHSDAAAA